MQIVLEMQELNKTTKLKKEESREIIKNLSKENAFDFTGYVEMQKEENEMDLGIFLELAKESKII